MTKISTKMIVGLLIISILTLTVGAINASNNDSNGTVIPTVVTTPNGTVIPTVVTTPNGTVIPTVVTTPNDTAVPVSEDTTQNVNQAVTQDVNQNNNQNININQNITVSAPVSIEEKDKATNVAINFVVNIGIDNPEVVDVVRKEENLHVRVKDGSGEYIVIIISPKGDVKEEIQNTPTFTETENNFVGRHVSFKFNKSSILNFTLEGKLIFSSINLGFSSTRVKRIGSTLRISDSKNTVIIHDNKNGVITESASGKIEATYTTVPEIDIKETNKRVEFSNNIKGSIINSDHDKMVVLVAGNTASIKIDHEKTTFTARVPGKRSEEDDKFEDRIVEGIDNKKIGTIINIDTEDSHDITGFDVDTTINKVVRNTVSLSVSSKITEGRTVVLRVGKTVLPDLNLRILVDGKEVKQAIDLEDLFKNDKLSYLIVVGQNVEVLVSIPKFSEHEIVVTSEPATVAAVVTGTTTAIATTDAGTPVPITTKAPGFTFGIVLVAMTALYFLLRKK